MAMNADVKREWTDALRSGEYPQAKGYLRTNAGYCCLGVLCEVAVRHDIIPEPHISILSEFYVRYGPDRDLSTLPDEVVQWAGLDSTNPVVEAPQGFLNANGDAKESTTLAELNDSEAGYDFNDIADIIDAQL